MLSEHGLNIRDINYTIVDTDSGDAVCTVFVAENQIPNQAAILQGLQTLLAQGYRQPSAVAYDRWFRLPKVRLTIVTEDRVGLVRDLIQSTTNALDRNRNACAGNILDLKGFSVSDEGLFAISLHVATTNLFVQAKLLTFFRTFCEQHHVRSYDVAYDNYLYDFVMGVESNAS